jgi:hypothetical protein
MPDRQPLHDYSRSRAGLVGTWDYRHLMPVPAARHSLNRMNGLLAGPVCEWSGTSIRIFENLRRPGDLADDLVSWFQSAHDVALFYFVGHGLIDDEDQLCLALGETVTDAHRRATTALPFSAVRRALRLSPALVKILILDCCFAGQATQHANALGPAADVIDSAGGTGAFTMAASGAYNTAWFETATTVRNPQTYFTKYFADVAEAGIPELAGPLRLSVLFDRVRENLARDQRPVPQSRNIDSAHEFVFARNNAAATLAAPVTTATAAVATPVAAAPPALVSASGQAPPSMQTPPRTVTLRPFWLIGLMGIIEFVMALVRYPTQYGLDPGWDPAYVDYLAAISVGTGAVLAVFVTSLPIRRVLARRISLIGGGSVAVAGLIIRSGFLPDAASGWLFRML